MPSPFPPDYLRFVELFNQGAFWESHEALEGAWRASRSGFYHGLILLASAHVHVQRANPRGVAAQMRKAARALEPFRPAYLGLDVDALLAHAGAALRALEDAPSPGGGLAALVPPIVLHPRLALVRGGEPELSGG
jgi:uncharacterized protein